MKKGVIFKSFLILMMLFCFPKNALALNFKVERSADTLKPGNDVTVYIKVTDASDIEADSLQNYNVTLSYDSSKLDYKSGASDMANIGAGNPITITRGAGNIDGNGTLATLVFNVKSNAKAGSTNLTVGSSNLTTISGKNKTATNTSSMINIAALSNDATLSSLKIPNATIKPTFSKNVTEYTADIKDITELTVNAVASASSSKIMISDNYKKLVKGENIIKVSVTAEDGSTTKTYVIKVNLTLTPTEEELLKANALLKKLEVKGYDIDFSSEEKKYILSVPYKVKKLKLKAEPVNEKATVKIEGTTNLKVGKNVIRLVVTAEDTTTTDNYTITVTREKEKKKIVQTCPDVTSSREWITFSISMIITFTLGIVLGFFVCKKDIFKKIFKKRIKQESVLDGSKLSDTIKIDTKKVKDANIEKNKKTDKKNDK